MYALHSMRNNTNCAYKRNKWFTIASVYFFKQIAVGAVWRLPGGSVVRVHQSLEVVAEKSYYLVKPVYEYWAYLSWYSAYLIVLNLSRI